ncbi:MAG: ABC transporter ATP-binding protein [Rhodospirillales bacterium]
MFEAGEGNGGRGRRQRLDDPGRPGHARPRADEGFAAVAASASASASPSGSGLRLTGVSHAFGKAAVLRNVSMTVDGGEIVCLLGPSGCGKTTLLRLAAGLEHLQHGRIEVGDHLVADRDAGIDRPPEARRVGLMFQDYALFPHLTVAENVRFGITKSAAGEEWTRTALAHAGLTAYANAYPHTLSGGQQQRCALLRALAPHPKLLLLDEPFSGLDVGLRARVREETAAFLRQTRISTLVVTHDPEEAMGLGDRLLLMRDGAIVQQGTPSEVYLAPVDPFVAGMFGPVNRWHGRVVEGRVETPLGRFPATTPPEGAKAVVLIRPEAIMIDPQGDDATVVESRLLGGVSAITVAVDARTDQHITGGNEIDGGEWRLRALVPGLFLPPPGTRLGVSADPARTFVFAET